MWNAGAVTQESLQNSSLGKSLYLLEWKKNKSTVRFFGVCAFVLSATDLMKCSSDYVLVIVASNSIHYTLPIGEYFL